MALNSSEISPETSLVEELFQVLSIDRINKINDQYRSNVAKSQTDLRNLVGDKYRDLLKITEQIGAISDANLGLHGKLSDLTYTESHFPSFEENSSLARFNLRFRHKNAQESQPQYKKILLNKLFSGKLLQLTLDLQRSNSIESLSELVQHAILMFTIGQDFHQQLKTNDFAKSRFEKLKQDLTNYLVVELSKYNLSESFLFSSGNDYISNLKRLDAKDLWLETSAFDMDLEYESDFEDDYVDENDFTGLHKSKNTPMVKFLIAFVILNSGEKTSLNSIGQSFANLRLEYLRSCLYNSGAENLDFDFTQFLKYIDNTYLYLKKYFIGENALTIEVKRLMKGWKVSDVLGRHDWMTSAEEVRISLNIMSGTEIQVTSHLGGFANLFEDFVTNLIQKRKSEFVKDSVHHFLILHNIILAFTKLRRQKESSDEKFEVLSTLCERDFFKRILDLILKCTEVSCNEHFEKLNSIIIEINAGQQSTSPMKPLFSQDFADSMERGAEKYIRNILRASRTSSSGTRRVKLWFSSYKDFSDSVDLSLDKASIMPKSYISKLLELLDNKLVSQDWGTFSADYLRNQMKTFNEKHSESFGVNLLQVIDSAKKHQERYNSVGSIFESLSLIIELKECVIQLKDSSRKYELNTSLDEFTLLLFAELIQKISNMSFMSNFEEHLANKSHWPIQIGSDSSFPSLLYVFNKDLTNGGRDELERGSIIVNPHIMEAFIEERNRFIHGLIHQITTSEISNENYTEAVLYLFHFISPSFATSTPDDFAVKSNLSRTVIEECAERVSSYFNSMKNLQLPLTLN